MYAASKVLSKYLQPLASNEYVIDNTLTFPDKIKNIPLNEDEEDVSYDVESLFTSIPVKDTIDYICNEIYVKKSLKPFCKKRLIFKRLLERLTKECVFSVNGRLIKQIDGCPMGGSISVVMAGIFMAKMENDIVNPLKPIFYNRYVDDIYVRRKKGIDDALFTTLNKYHQNINLTVESNPDHFLDSALSIENGNMITKVYTKLNKFPVFWSSQVPKRYKRNAIKGELHRASKISSNLEAEIIRIRIKFLNAGYPKRFVESVIREFLCPDDSDDDLIIPEWLFDDRKLMYVRLPFCQDNEHLSKAFLSKVTEFTENKYRFMIVWETRKIRTLFPLKDKVKHKACLIYEGVCSCGEKYVGETIRNSESRFNEHNTPSRESEPSKHLLAYPAHSFQWNVITSAPQLNQKRKIIEAYYIAKFKPSLNDQLDSKLLLLFRNGVT